MNYIWYTFPFHHIFWEWCEYHKIFFFFFDAEEGSSWDVVNEKDLWDGEAWKFDEDDYVLVRQEDIVDGIACFMAACVLSRNDTKVCALLLQLPLNLYAFNMSSSFGHTQNTMLLCNCVHFSYP